MQKEQGIGTAGKGLLGLPPNQGMQATGNSLCSYLAPAVSRA
jgi:hypothetical protein